MVGDAQDAAIGTACDRESSLRHLFDERRANFDLPVNNTCIMATPTQFAAKAFLEREFGQSFDVEPVQ